MILIELILGGILISGVFIVEQSLTTMQLNLIFWMSFILSSIFEGLPNVLLEALTLKKTIISSDCPTGPKEILDHGKGGLIFKMNNEFDLYKKIIFFIKNKSKSEKLVTHGYNRLTRFDYQKNLEEYLKILSS